MRLVHVLSLSAVFAIALPLAACGDEPTSTSGSGSAPATSPVTVAEAPAEPVEKTTPTKADKTDIPGASQELKSCLGKAGFYAVVMRPGNTRIETKGGDSVASFLTHASVADAEKFAGTLTVKDPLQRGKVTAVFLGSASKSDRRVISTCFQKL